MSDTGIALAICATPFVVFSVLAGLADLFARIWPPDVKLDDWQEWYD